MAMSTKLSAEQLAEIRERVEKATAKPWVNQGRVVVDENSIVVGRESYDWRFVAHVNSDEDESSDTPVISKAEALCNAEFIAHARTDIPALLDHCTALESELKATQDFGDGHHIAERILIEFQEGRLREGDVKGICQNIQQDAINNFRAQLVEAVRRKFDGYANDVAEFIQTFELEK